jgi:diguanylate cyclase (GGDEF)-like protein
MKNVFKNLARLSKSQIIVAGIFLTIALSLIDYITGWEISFSIFYLLPICLLAWYAGKNHGIIMAVFCAVIWFMTDTYPVNHYSNPIFAYWNAAVRLGFFLLFSIGLSTIKKIYELQRILSTIDPLTGLLNQRAFYEQGENEVMRSGRSGRPVTLCYIDLDNFKKVNDSCGHLEGNRVLQLVAETLQHNVRSMDIASRLGGDEFAVILPETDSEQARIVIERIQNILAEKMKEKECAVTFSIGVATFPEPPEGLDNLIKAADELMYEVKQTGKNTAKYLTIAA